MPRYFVPITILELQKKIARLTSKFEHVDYVPGAFKNDAEQEEQLWYDNGYMIREIFEKDLMKVQFDFENFEVEEGHFGPKGLMGYHTLSNGFTFLGCCAGGDWEVPVFFIIYWDGKKLRAYIPTDGNPWNTDMGTAYGSEDWHDYEGQMVGADENAKKRGWESMEDANFDPVEIEVDITSRIHPRKK